MTFEVWPVTFDHHQVVNTRDGKPLEQAGITFTTKTGQTYVLTEYRVVLGKIEWFTGFRFIEEPYGLAGTRRVKCYTDRTPEELVAIPAEVHP